MQIFLTTLTADADRVEAIRTAGSTAERQLRVAILIELKAQFYKLVTL